MTLRLGLGQSLSGGGGRPSAGPVFTAGPTLTGTDQVGDTLTAAVTVTGTGTISVVFNHMRDGVQVATETKPATSGVEVTATYVTAAAGNHTVITIASDDLGTRAKQSLPVLTLTSEALWLWNDGQSVALNDNTPLETEA